LIHPWEDKGYILPNELGDVEFILLEEGSETHITVREALAEVGLSIYQLKSIMVLCSAEAVALSVQEELGGGFVSEIVVNKLVQNR